MNSSSEQHPGEEGEDHGPDAGQWHLPGSTPQEPQHSLGEPSEQNYPLQGYPPQNYPPPGYSVPPGYNPQPGQGTPPSQGGPPGYQAHGYAPHGYPPQGYPPHGYPPQGYYGPQQKTGFSFGAQIGFGVLIGMFLGAGVFIVLLSTVWSMGILPTVITAAAVAAGAIIGMFFSKTRGYSTGILIAYAASWIVLLGPCLIMFSY